MMGAALNNDGHVSPPLWRGIPVSVIAGLGDTRKKAGAPYAVRPLGEIFQAKACRLPKERAPAFLPSTYAESDARAHEAQRERGSFVALVGDVDKGDHPLGRVRELVEGFANGAAWMIYSTASATPSGKRWRVVLPLDGPVSFSLWYDSQLALTAHMAAGGIEMDTCAARPGQVSFLPNVPSEMRDEAGEPVFFQQASSAPDACGLQLHSGPVADGIEAIGRQRKADDAERERIRQEAERRYKARPVSSNDASVIDTFNRSNSVENLLRLYEYQQSPRDGRDWRSQYQTSGSFATRVLDGGKWVSLSGSDASAGLGAQCSSGCYGDAYDLFVHYDHGGDRRAAWKAACEEQGRGRTKPTSDAQSARDDARMQAGSAGKHGERRDPRDEEINSKWPQPVNLWARYAEPPLPMGLLPELIEQFAVKQGKIMGADPAGLAMAALTVCAAAIPDAIAIQVKQNDPTWRENARLWTALVGPPSRKKTPIFKAALAPLRILDNHLMRTYMDALSTYNSFPPAERAAMQRPKQKRHIISDTTVEAAQEVLRDSPDGVLSEQDELSGWFGAMDKYAPGKGAQADRAFWLKSFNGGTYNLNRVTRGATQIQNLSVSLLGGIQPDPMRKLAAETMDDGLVQRLLPVILRPSEVGQDVPCDEVTVAYERLVGQLALLQPPQRVGIGRAGDYAKPLALRFSAGAKAIRDRLEREHLELVDALESASPKLSSHFGKYDGIFARLCLLWHCIDHADASMPPQDVSEGTAERVAQFMADFIRPSAIAFYAGLLGMSAGHEDLVSLASWIVAKRLDEVKARDAQSSSQSFRAMSAEDFRLLCERLESFGWLERGEPGPKSVTPRWLVNPRVHDLFSQRAEQEVQRRSRARDALRAALNV